MFKPKKKHRPPRETPEYDEGRQAFEIDGATADCPYPVGSGNYRTNWWIGYLDARTEDRLGRVAKSTT